jgi:hypothetical protein
MKKHYLALLATAVAALLLLAACQPSAPDETPDAPAYDPSYNGEDNGEIPYDPPESISGTRTLTVNGLVISEAKFDFYLNSVFREDFMMSMNQEELEEAAAEQIQTIMALVAYAEANGIELTEDDKTSIMGPAIEYADSIGVTVEQLLTDTFGPLVTPDEYQRLIEQSILSNRGGEALFASFSWSDAELEAQYEIIRDNLPGGDEYMNDVRHLLIQVEEDSEFDTPDKARARAEELLQMWKDGGSSENYFIELVSRYTTDYGSADTGGLYTDITPSSGYMEDFLNWTIDAGRRPGDTGIVEVEGWYHGFHIMYFVRRHGPAWKQMVGDELNYMSYTETLESLREEYTYTFIPKEQ